MRGEGGMHGEGGVHGGGACMAGETGRAWQVRRPVQRTVHILLEYILVSIELTT